MAKHLKKEKTVRTYSDKDCPKCGFPETVIVRDGETMKSLSVECSNSKKCDWNKKL